MKTSLQSFSLLTTLALAPGARAGLITFSAVLSGSQEVPANASPGTGVALVIVDDVLNSVSVNLAFGGLLFPTTAAHIHCCSGPGVNSPVVLGFAPAFPVGVTSGAYSNVFTGVSVADITGLKNSGGYINVHTSGFPGGEIRANLVPSSVATLSGSQEVPPNASPGFGFAAVTVNEVLNSVSVNLAFSGLLFPTTAAHIHCCSGPGVNSPVVLNFAPTFPLGVTSGGYSNVFTGVSLENITGLKNSGGYVNIHTSGFPGGEIRADLVNVGVPEPASGLLMGLALAAAALAKLRLRKI